MSLEIIKKISEMGTKIVKEASEKVKGSAEKVNEVEYNPDDRLESNDEPSEKSGKKKEYDPDDRLESNDEPSEKFGEKEEYDPDDRLESNDEPSEKSSEKEECTPDDELRNETDNEDNELTEDEINEKQRSAIKEAIERIKNGEKLTNEELGNLGEMMMDQYYISKGYKPLNKNRVTSLDDKKGGFKTGIDGVYEKTNPDGTKSYVIADAKYNTSQLSETNDGKQMSDNWIDKRLDDAVGKEKADEIRDSAEDNPDSVKHEVYHIDPNVDENGNMHTDTQEVDSEGDKVGDKTIVEYFDKEGNRIVPSSEE